MNKLIILILCFAFLFAACNTADQQIPFLEPNDELMIELLKANHLDIIGFACTDHWFQKNENYLVIPEFEESPFKSPENVKHTMWFVKDINPNAKGIKNKLDELLTEKFSYSTIRDTTIDNYKSFLINLEYRNQSFICDIIDKNIEICPAVINSINRHDKKNINKNIEYYYLTENSIDSSCWSMFIYEESSSPFSLR